jgi:redox-sensitive bicupin YhaK (pirin superfamily)
MKTIVHKADSRGAADHGWLKAQHSFSFANYYHPEKVHFGVLRVLNDDTIAPGAGFPTHPHDNMEIITIPLSGKLEHKDSMGNTSVISAGEVQVMSAGTGIFHSEYNFNQDKGLQLFQIWLFPKIKNVEPRYDQVSIKSIEKENELFQILSPNKDDQGVWIYQDAWFSLGNFTKPATISYSIKRNGNGLYLMVIEGHVHINGHDLHKRDAIGITDTSIIDIEIKDKTQLLVMDIPMIT